MSHRDASGLARAARGMLTQRDASVIESLPDIKVPSLVVVGADDTPFLAASDYMAAKIPGAKKVVIPAAGHAVNIDQPQAFIDAVLPFLDTCRAAPRRRGRSHERVAWRRKLRSCHSGAMRASNPECTKYSYFVRTSVRRRARYRRGPSGVPSGTT